MSPLPPAGPPRPTASDAPTGPIRVVGSTPSRRRTGAALSLLGLAIIITGTFLPWLTSGQVNRNSYAVAGLADRLLLEPGSLGAALVNAWPFLGPALLLSVVAGALRWWRSAALIAIVGSVVAGGVALLAVTTGSGDALIRLNLLGPAVVLAGAVVAVSGAVVVLTASRRQVVRRSFP